ncbi:hypothetical protein TSMEX_010889 [Taenia solium]|eukprot:TsM_001223900 transcript=TsM_001223900 gene=TsM_001223900
MDKGCQNVEIHGDEISDSGDDASRMTSIGYSPIELDQLSLNLDEGIKKNIHLKLNSNGDVAKQRRFNLMNCATGEPPCN